MQTILEELVGYLEEALGVSVTPSMWKNARLPHFVKESYGLSEIELMGAKCLLMIDSRTEEQAPAAVRKHMALVHERWDGAIIYVRARSTAYNRKRLVQQKVPFIVPGNQMYLPQLGIDFREHFRQLHEEPETLSPSAQVFLIHALLGAGRDVLTPKDAAVRLGYSAMTMTRAFNALEATRLVEVSSSGKERHLRLKGKAYDTWTKAQPFLRSPVKKQFCVQHISAATSGPRAGLTALAEYTMLAPPTRTIHALSQTGWASLKRRHTVIEVPKQDPEALGVEVWSYSPAQLAVDDLVDPLSLYLSLRDSDDERVAAALEELMDKVKW